MLNANIHFAPINASASGDNTIVAAISGKRIRVVNYFMIAANAVNATWKSGSSASLSGALPLVANVGGVCPEAVLGWLITTAGEALVLNLSGAVLVAGHIACVYEG